MRLGLLLCVAVPVVAQVAAVSQISGIIQDASGAAIAGARVTITNTDTSASRTLDSAADGSYAVTNLVAGPYQLQVAKDGFTPYTQNGIVLQVNTNPQINVTLKVGGVTEQIEVRANAGMVETQNTSVGQVIDQQRVVDLPLNGRNAAQLIALSGAAVVNTGGGVATNLNYPTVAAFSVAGGQGNQTNYFLDGSTHIDPRTNVGMPLPFPDALQEFKVETSTLPANYGSHPGGAVNVITKSGTNAVHGDAFEFLRNYVFNARNFFAPARDSLKRNQFGGVIGGPIKKDKLFFFAGFQGTTERTAPATNQAFVPTAAVLQGNFQTILSPPCQRTPVTLNAASGAVNNVIPQSMLNPIALKFLSLLPVSADSCGRILYGIPQIDNEYQGTGRLDWQRTEKDSIFFRYFVTNYTLDAFYNTANLLTAGNPGLQDQVQSLTAGDTHLISSTIVNSFRASFSRSAVVRVGANGVPTIAQLGSNIYSPIPNYSGQIQVPGYFTLSSIPGWVYTNISSLGDELGMTHGAHQLTFGVSWVHTQMNGDGPFQQNPRFTFNGQLTGNALADFLTGNVDTFLQGNGQIARDAANAPSLYAQDNWKVNKRLQLNLGIRWDPFIPQHQLYGYASQFDPAKFYAGQTSTVLKLAPPGLTFPGDAGFPGRSDTFPRYGDIAPRFGFVLDPRGKGTETLRGGYGMFWDSAYLWNTLHVPLNPPWGETITLPNVNLSSPWQNYPGGNPFPSGTPGPNFQFPLDGTYVFEPLHAHATYVQQWNVSFQKQLGADWLVSATYLGNKTTHQWLGHELNPAVYGPGATLGNQESRRVFILANPSTGKYFGSTIMIDDNGNASYNGLLLSLNHRFSHSFSVLANYTLSHCFDQGEANQDITNYYQNPNNRRAEWASCSFDRRQVFNLSAVTQSPKFSSAWVQRIAGGWQLSPIFTAYTGTPLNITDGTDISLTGIGLDRPNVIGNGALPNPTIAQWFNTAAFAKQAPGTYGNAGRNLLVGPGAWNLDAALSRSFVIRENVKLNFRWEAFNVFNHARFNNPGTSLSSGTTFGIISTAQDPRIMQVAAKIVF
ncbi:MAG: TonB-dependent receptor [Bryobacterales bacterium]|nr:TonB-dependent receptor [Bryobacterales bacterium]